MMGIPFVQTNCGRRTTRAPSHQGHVYFLLTGDIALGQHSVAPIADARWSALQSPDDNLAPGFFLLCTTIATGCTQEDVVGHILYGEPNRCQLSNRREIRKIRIGACFCVAAARMLVPSEGRAQAPSGISTRASPPCSWRHPAPLTTSRWRDGHNRECVAWACPFPPHCTRINQGAHAAQRGRTLNRRQSDCISEDVSGSIDRLFETLRLPLDIPRSNNAMQNSFDLKRER